VLARISGEVGTLCTVLLSVYSGTWLPIFIEIGSYLTDTEQIKKALRETQNLRAGCSKAAQLLDVAKRPIPQG